MKSLRFLIAATIGTAALGFAPYANDAATSAAPAAETPVTSAVASDRTVSATDRMAEDALTTMYGQVAMMSHRAALRYAFEAYFAYRDANPGMVRKPYLYFVDFGLPSTQPRGYVFDMDRRALIEGPFTVAHGRGSARGNTPIPTAFSNRNGSNATSLGLFVAEETYSFWGKSGGRSYRSIGLRMDGVSGGFNGAARKRGVVVHGAPYVTPERAGRSEGCPAMEPDRAERLLPLLSGGSLVFLFSPYDREWLRLEPWVADDLAPVLPRLELASFR